VNLALVCIGLKRFILDINVQSTVLLKTRNTHSSINYRWVRVTALLMAIQYSIIVCIDKQRVGVGTVKHNVFM